MIFPSGKKIKKKYIISTPQELLGKFSAFLIMIFPLVSGISGLPLAPPGSSGAARLMVPKPCHANLFRVSYITPLQAYEQLHLLLYMGKREEAFCHTPDWFAG